MSPAKLSLGVAGAGKWGGNHVATAAALGVLGAICDADAALLGKVWDSYPDAQVTTRYADLLKMPVDAIVIATPAQTHAQLALAAIAAGKHVFVEKPLALEVGDAQRIVDEARRRNVRVFVGHIVLYQQAVRNVLEQVSAGAIGDVFHVRARRASFGRLRFVEDVWWSFAPHDVATVLEIMGEVPVDAVMARQSYATRGIADFAYADFRFSRDRTAHTEVTWLDPNKGAQLDVFGSGGVLRLREGREETTVTMTPCGVNRDNATRPELWRRDGQTVRFERDEPLRTELQAFLTYIRQGGSSPTDGEAGLRVVRALAMAAAPSSPILHEIYERTPV